MIRKLAHLCVITTDLDATRRFYCDVLGLSVKFTFERSGREQVGYYLDLGGGTYIEVFRGDAATGESAIKHFCLETDDVRAVKARLEANGIEATEPKLGSDESWQIWCKDPNGIGIEFHEYTDKSLQRVGGVAKVNW